MKVAKKSIVKNINKVKPIELLSPTPQKINETASIAAMHLDSIKTLVVQK